MNLQGQAANEAISHIAEAQSSGPSWSWWKNAPEPIQFFFSYALIHRVVTRHLTTSPNGCDWQDRGIYSLFFGSSGAKNGVMLGLFRLKP